MNASSGSGSSKAEAAACGNGAFGGDDGGWDAAGVTEAGAEAIDDGARASTDDASPPTPRFIENVTLEAISTDQADVDEVAAAATPRSLLLPLE